MQTSFLSWSQIFQSRTVRALLGQIALNGIVELLQAIQVVPNIDPHILAAVNSVLSLLALFFRITPKQQIQG